MKLSKNFFLSEFINSPTAIRADIDNYPGPKEVAKLQLLCENILQPIRERYTKPIRINSGYRSPTLNIYLKGAAGSQHTKGEAADIDTTNDNIILFNMIREYSDFDQLIWEYGDLENPAWIHVSYKPDGTNRGQVLRAMKIEGKTSYVNF